MNEDYLRVKALEFAMETMRGASETRILASAQKYYEFLSGNTNKEDEK